MKAISKYTLVAFALMLIVSCEKEVIPTPGSEPAVSANNSLFISGNFGGVEKNMVIDELNYAAVPYLYAIQGGSIDEWSFDVINLIDTIGFPEFSIRILNHDQSSPSDYDDLVQTTSGSTLEFVTDTEPISTQEGHITMIYSDSPNNFYISDLSTNTSLDVLDAKDTIVDGVQYRIVELSGTVNLTDIGTQDEISIDQFHARIALGL